MFWAHSGLQIWKRSINPILKNAYSRPRWQKIGQNTREREILPVVDYLCLGFWYKFKKGKIVRGLQEFWNVGKLWHPDYWEQFSLMRQNPMPNSAHTLLCSSSSRYRLKMMLSHLSIIKQKNKPYFVSTYEVALRFEAPKPLATWRRTT